jgi:adenylate cyclase
VNSVDAAIPEDVAAVVKWLIDGARPTRLPHEALDTLCAKLVACGLPLDRAAVFVNTPHPDIMGRMFLWRRGQGVEVSETGFDILDTDTHRISPVAHVLATRATVRRRLCEPGAPNDFPVLDELRAMGVTDYVAYPLEFMNGEVHIATWSTKAPGGFGDSEIASLAAICAPLSRVAEIYALRRTVVNLLNTYVGPGSGERILAGQIRLGNIDRIVAAILSSDMRGFTALSDTLPGEAVIELLNRYYDCQVPAIQARDGEILKYIGDGLLAIFQPRRDGRDIAGACRDALSAARTVLERIAEHNARQRDAGRPVAGIRFALHVGEVLYGNIGASGRLDFTVIGPGVNLAARLEALASDLGRDLVASAAFAQHCPDDLESLGKFAIRGFRDEQEVFGLAAKL